MIIVKIIVFLLEVYYKCQPILAFRAYISNNLPLILKLIGYNSKSHLLKVGFDLLRAQQLCKRVYHIVCGVDSLDLDVILLEVITDEVVSPLDVLEFLVRPRLLNKGYGAIVVAVQRNGI